MAEDRTTINAICKFGGDIGSFSAGAMSNSNKIVDKYISEMVETEISKNLNEELNMEIFRATAKADQRDPLTVRGTGTISQNVPEYMRGDLCDRPGKNDRPLQCSDTAGLDEEGLCGSAPSKPDGSPEGGSSSDSTGPAGRLGYQQDISPDRISSDVDDKNGGFFSRCFG